MAHEETATQLIPKLDDTLHQFVIKKLKEKIKKDPTPWSTWRSSHIYWFGDTSTGYYCLEHEGDILYFVRYKAIKANKMRFGRQILVWRNRTLKGSESAGFAKEIFFNVLLPKFKALIADQEQTQDGMAFWQHALSEAINQSYRFHSYFLDRRATPNVLHEIQSYADVLKYDKELWGTSEGHRRTFAVISTVPLEIKA
ncbi:hypothetical protein [Burkholderia phage BCSR5]|nr:hypothetical protein [Burkholderia phage BCSR5]